MFRQPFRAARPAVGLLTFFGLSFGLTWLFWIPAGLAVRGELALPVPVLLLMFIGGFGPMAAAIGVTSWTRGWAGARRLFAQLDPRGVRARWWAACLVLLPVNLVPVALHIAGTGQLPSPSVVAQALAAFPLQFVLVAVAGGGLDEEMGWRGYALPGLLKAIHPVTAHLILGALWACWHLPLWLDPTSSHAAYPFWVFLLRTIALSVVIGWLYTASGGSLLVAIVAHSVSNAADGVRYQLVGAALGDLTLQISLLIATLAVALIVAVRTQWRLGHPASSDTGSGASVPNSPPGSRDLRDSVKGGRQVSSRASGPTTETTVRRERGTG